MRTLFDCYAHIRDNFSNPKALNFKEKGQWVSISTKTFVKEVEYIALGLVKLGLKKGDRVGIYSHPTPYWTIVDLAIMVIGGVSVSLFPNLSEDNFLYEVAESEIKLIFIDGKEQWEVYRRHKNLFNQAISMTEHISDEGVLSYAEVVDLGKNVTQERPDLFKDLTSSVKDEDIASIIYTSGSTGGPKGVLLTHWNFMCTHDFDGFSWHKDKDRYLSVLPLAHVLGRCVNLWILGKGISVYYSNDYKNLGAICREVKPTIMTVVPRLLEKVYAKIMEQIDLAPFLKRVLSKWAIHLLSSDRTSFYRFVMFPLADLLVFSKFRKALGGCLTTVLCGGAHLNPRLQIFFSKIGIPIYEGWGLTEACPVCVNLEVKNKFGTVGPAIKPHKLAISEQGEVLVQGPLVMKGYYKNPQATERTIDSEGWLHTGDRGSLDEDGYLTILGRMKELYKTSTGEYVAPVPIEQALCSCPYVENAMVIAEGRKFASCLLFPNFDTLKRIKEKNKMSHISDEEFLNGPLVRKEMERLINEINTHLNHAEQIHDYRFILTPLTIEGGELTPSMKIRRDLVEKKYQAAISTMYNEEVEKWKELPL